MKKFQLNVSVMREHGIDTLVSTSGDFVPSEVREAIGVVKEAIIAEDDDGASYSGSVRVFDSETDAEDLNVSVSKANKSTMMEIVSFMNEPTAATSAPEPVAEATAETENAKESDEQQ